MPQAQNDEDQKRIVNAALRLMSAIENFINAKTEEVKRRTND